MTEPFGLPVLELRSPDDVLADSITRIRQDRIRRCSEEEGAAAGGGGDRIFSEQELDLMRKVFAAHDPDGRGLIRCDELWAMLGELGVEVDEAWLHGLLQDLLGAEADTTMSFVEVVDVTAIVLQSAPAEEETEGEEEEGEEGDSHEGEEG